ncbi:hypothetical protein GCM10022419_073970 [Nonomuraea rosea]|uniref:Uncharacterized protein n=1 Tax=Nonomuraea rosea TaxID=638574 RepID=A0ABP6YDH2_9ACTN
MPRTPPARRLTDVKVLGPVVKLGLSATTQEWLAGPSKAGKATLSVS